MRIFINAFLTAALFFFCLILSGCSAAEVDKSIDKPRENRPTEQETFIRGLLCVKITEDVSGRITKSTKSLDPMYSEEKQAFAEMMPDLDISRVERIFPYAGKYEQRTREAGLHLWYNVYFDNETGYAKTKANLDVIDGIHVIERRPITVRIGQNDWSPLSMNITGTRSAVEDVFDDPLLVDQWHYHNDGTISSSAIAGADINVLSVWKKGLYGDPDVIVAVTDGGMDWNHEDLRDNIWTGYNEDGEEIHGYNFYTDSYDIDPEDHATHVAGTIAAVNNNGIGVCGIAGGNKAEGIPGVKIMACQIMQNNTGGMFAGASAIKWSADHGAVISQNSWGYDERIGGTPQLDKDAIDYFVKYAGMDETGTEQVGPMAGGVVIFAAGNANLDVGYPAMYEPCIAVSALAPDFGAAIYTNYGEWVDISAPGGDSNEAGYYLYPVLSTVAFNQYGYMSGTSMACPHVSGVAALMVSQFGGPGFTNDDLKARLMESTVPVDYFNPDRAGMLGSGAVNAYLAVFDDSKTPDPVSDLDLKVTADRVDISFTVPQVEPVNALLVYSEGAITESNVKDAGCFIANLSSFHAGDVYNGEMFLGEFEKKFNMAVATVTREGKVSELSEVVSIETKPNNAPVIKALDGTKLLPKKGKMTEYRFVIRDYDGHTFRKELMPEYSYIYMRQEENDSILNLVFNGRDVDDKEHVTTIQLTDQHGAVSTLRLDFRFVDESMPEVVQPIPTVSFISDQANPYVLDLTEYIVDADGDIPDVRYELSGDDVADIIVDGMLLTITPKAYGTAQVKLKCYDPSGLYVSATFDITVGGAEPSLTLYPNPVTDRFYIKSDAGTFDGRVEIYSSAGARVLDEIMEIGGSEAVDAGHLPSGSYTVSVSHKEMQIKMTMVKI